ncbi:MAG: hypothetical protein Q7J28_03475 [Caulobacter sp.]|nr:hypothetical protein [Caulobacter sp.]
MAPTLLLAFALLAQDAPPAINDDGPVATAAPRKQDVAPLPIQGGRVTPPTDDYGYVGWCFGAVSGYVDLYDRAMPEVIRIERAWPTPGTEENIKTVYPAQKRDAARSLELFRRAIEAAEKASPSPIASQGAAAIKKGRGVWTGAGSVPKAQLAQFWMSWSPPARCEETAKALEARSNLFGQALTANTVAAEDTPAEAVAVAPVETPAPAEDVEAVAEAAVIDAPEAPAEASAVDVAEAPAAEAEEASAIDALLPEPAEAEPMAAVAPPVVKPATPPAAAPARPASKAKPGLRDTLRGLRGPQ